MCYCKNHGKRRRKTRHAALLMLENPVGGLTVPKSTSHSDSQSRHCLQKPKPILYIHLCPPSTKTHPSSVSFTQGQCNHLGNRARQLADHGYRSVDDNTNWFWTPSLSSSLQAHLLPNFCRVHLLTSLKSIQLLFHALSYSSRAFTELCFCWPGNQTRTIAFAKNTLPVFLPQPVTWRTSILLFSLSKDIPSSNSHSLLPPPNPPPKPALWTTQFSWEGASIAP